MDERRGGGSSRDAFQKRMEAQYSRLFKETARRIGKWAQREKLNPVFIAGPGEVVTAIAAELPAAIRDRVEIVQGEYAQLSAAELQKRLDPIVAKWKRARESEHVAAIIANRNVSKAVVGITKTLTALQNGEARALVVSRGLRGRLQQCSECGWTDSAADRTCRICGGKRERVSFRETLPELARRFSVPVEVVGGAADRDLREVGGLAAWLQ